MKLARVELSRCGGSNSLDFHAGTAAKQDAVDRRSFPPTEADLRGQIGGQAGFSSYKIN